MRAEEVVGDRVEVQVGVGAAVGQHRPVGALHEHDDRAGGRVDGLQVAVDAGQQGDVPIEVGGVDRTDEGDVGSERREPRGRVRRRAARRR